MRGGNVMGYNDSKINGYGQKNDEKYVGAPYNFIPFSNKNVEVTEEQMAVHDRSYQLYSRSSDSYLSG